MVDDDATITDALAALLRREGFVVDVAYDGESALTVVALEEPDLVVLDIVLPGIDGRAVLRRLRADGRTVPVILLTSVGEAAERARALDEGADDYLNKPFDHSELVSRTRAILRRTQRGTLSLAASPRLRAGDPAGGPAGVLLADRLTRRYWLGDRELVLTPKTTTLLDYLLTHPDELISRDRLLEAVWGFEDPIGTRAVDQRVAELRKALGDDAAHPHWLTTVPGQGYRFHGPVAADC